MSRIIGIDLGTTNSAAAYLAEDGPKLITNSLGETLTPSAVAIDSDGNVLVGRAAKEFFVVEPKRCALMFKRHMGSDWKAKLPGREFSPEELSSLVLRSLKDDASAFFHEPVKRAVITVPAYFNDRQRKATINAGRIAGLEVERIVNEPTAAALAYGFHEGRQEKVLLVCDLGGGTFDASVVELFEGTLEVRASSGESLLGGEDFTRTLAARVLEARGYVFERAEIAHPRLVSRMIQQCELAKCRLWRQETAAIKIPSPEGDIGENAAQVEVSRTEFNNWTKSILQRVEAPIRRVLGDAGLRPQDVHEVILVGGATRMQAVVEFFSNLLGREPQQRLNPDEVVAMGASVQAGLISRDAAVADLVVTDVAPFTLGVEISKQFGLEFRDGYFMPIIQRNTTIPVSRVRRVNTLVPNQTEVTVRVFQGESRRIQDNLLLGEFQVKGIPRGPAGQEIDIRFTYDLNGVLEVEATIVATRKQVGHIITRHARGLSAEGIQRAVQDMARLKTHPREETVNRFLLRRAERIYRELPLADREYLSQLLDGFEGALELQEPDAVAEHRRALQEFLDHHDQNLGDCTQDECGDDEN